MGMMPCIGCDHVKSAGSCDGCNDYEYGYKRYMNKAFMPLWNKYPEMRAEADYDFWFDKSLDRRWISVKDDLPEIDIDDPKPVPVLVYEYGYICVGQYGARTKYFDHFAKEFCVDGEASTGVTHWMPLPSPPQEET